MVMTNNITPDESSAEQHQQQTNQQFALQILEKALIKIIFRYFFFHCIEPWINETPNCENILVADIVYNFFYSKKYSGCFVKLQERTIIRFCMLYNDI